MSSDPAYRGIRANRTTLYSGGIRRATSFGGAHVEIWKGRYGNMRLLFSRLLTVCIVSSPMLAFDVCWQFGGQANQFSRPAKRVHSLLHRGPMGGQMISVSVRLTSTQSTLTLHIPIFLFSSPAPHHCKRFKVRSKCKPRLAFLLRPYQLKFFQQRCRRG